VGHPKTDVLQGTLDLMVMKTLDAMGSQHGYGIAQRLQQVSGDLLRLNQGTLYPALLRLEQRGWITSKWGVSENNRRARYYSLTRTGRKQLDREASDWNRMAAIMARVLGTSEETS
jgi:PadR family transcriptional regulator, regulatory protein PadR